MAAELGPRVRLKVSAEVGPRARLKVGAQVGPKSRSKVGAEVGPKTRSKLKQIVEVGFDESYEAFIQTHCKRRTGERLRRLRDGHGHAEKSFLYNVWWPTFHHFKHLHPEYEVQDYKDGYRYLDFAYVQPHFRIAIEIDGLTTHWRNITKFQFSDHCHRQNHLVIDGWNVLRFTYDDIVERPRLCEQTIQQLLGRWLSSTSVVDDINAFEKEIIRLVIRSLKPITPGDVGHLLRVSSDYAQKLLRTLVEKQWLQPSGGTVRIRSYTLHSSRTHIKL